MRDRRVNGCELQPARELQQQLALPAPPRGHRPRARLHRPEQRPAAQPLPVHLQRVRQLVHPAPGRRRARRTRRSGPRPGRGPAAPGRRRARRPAAPGRPPATASRSPASTLPWRKLPCSSRSSGGSGGQLVARRERRGDQRSTPSARLRGRPHRLRLPRRPLRDRLEGVARPAARPTAAAPCPPPPAAPSPPAATAATPRGAAAPAAARRPSGTARAAAPRPSRPSAPAPPAPVRARRRAGRASARPGVPSGCRTSTTRLLRPPGAMHPLDGPAPSGPAASWTVSGSCPSQSSRPVRRLAERPDQPLRRFESHTCVVPFRRCSARCRRRPRRPARRAQERLRRCRASAPRGPPPRAARPRPPAAAARPRPVRDRSRRRRPGPPARRRAARRRPRPAPANGSAYAAAAAAGVAAQVAHGARQRVPPGPVRGVRGRAPRPRGRRRSGRRRPRTRTPPRARRRARPVRPPASGVRSRAHRGLPFGQQIRVRGAGRRDRGEQPGQLRLRRRARRGGVRVGRSGARPRPVPSTRGPAAVGAEPVGDADGGPDARVVRAAERRRHARRPPPAGRQPPCQRRMCGDDGVVLVKQRAARRGEPPPQRRLRARRIRASGAGRCAGARGSSLEQPVSAAAAAAPVSDERTPACRPRAPPRLSPSGLALIIAAGERTCGSGRRWTATPLADRIPFDLTRDDPTTAHAAEESPG